MVQEFRERRDIFCAALNEVPGFVCTMPAGAFYAFPNVKGTGMDSKVLADFLLDTAGVSCLDGRAFGDYGGGYIRFSYANSKENLLEAARRIKSVSKRWTQ
jgi:aspartate/methionine/tyrosine aminotransferase